ncbi:hypothetical protein BVC80_117g13 [Macleaya cordata]|uniref:Uncharacterized protein n=1 Tax=Macleaya cordata TaxID=56857 RepID=A0A200QR52_MACCD|nr:hypothetical protein BVC80_117g13 [Macleaya cordata]
MSLVDYASSSEDEDADIKENKDEEEDDPPPATLDVHDQRSISSSRQLSDSASQSSSLPIEKLPDVSLLLNSPTLASHQMSGNDHSSRVAAAMAESASRKREPNGSASTYPRSKYPRGSLPHTKNLPDTVGGVLVPPQLKGSSLDKSLDYQ